MAIDLEVIICWHDSGKEPTQAPNPDYPDGIDLDLTEGRTPNCYVQLAYPAPRIGCYDITCKKCGIRVACTTAGRPDDPRSIRIPCKREQGRGD